MDGPESPVILVTGAGGGLGQALVRAFSAAGWRVVAAGHSHSPPSDQPGVWPCQLDVTRGEESRALMRAIADRWGRLDALINNAGITRDQVLTRLSIEDWEAVIAVHLKGAFLCTQAAVELLSRRGGHILNIASHAARHGAAGQANYAAAKAGLIGLTFSLARELADREIRVNALLPGVLPTGMTAGLGEQRLEVFREANVLHRLNRPEEVAAFVLALTRTRDVSGQVFPLDSRIVRWT